MQLSPEQIPVFFAGLSVWNLSLVPLGMYLVVSDEFESWSKWTRIGFAVAMVGLLADPVLSFAKISTFTSPYWAFKDLGMGIMILSVVIPKSINFLKQRRKTSRNEPS